MWAVGISFLMMGSVPFWLKRLGGNQEAIEIPTYKYMFRCGISILILWSISFFLPDPYNTIIPVLPVLVLGVWMMKFISTLMIEDKENGVDAK